MLQINYEIFLKIPGTAVPKTTNPRSVTKYLEDPKIIKRRLQAD